MHLKSEYWRIVLAVAYAANAVAWWIHYALRTNGFNLTLAIFWTLLLAAWFVSYRRWTTRRALNGDRAPQS
jgi:hypothetical protein